MSRPKCVINVAYSVREESLRMKNSSEVLKQQLVPQG
jgi:hypothetical protein